MNILRHFRDLKNSWITSRSEKVDRMASYDMKQSICLPEKDCPRTFKPFVKTNFSFGCVGRKVGHDVTQTKCRHFRAMTKFLKHHKNNLIRWKPFLLTTSREMALIRRGMLDASLVGKWDKSCQMKSKLKWPNARFIRVWVTIDHILGYASDDLKS